MTFTVQQPNAQEFGKQFAISKTFINDEQAVQAAYAAAIHSFFNAKKENFPNWSGLPEIKVGPSIDPLGRDVSIAWYARVDTSVVDTLNDDLALWDE